MPHDKSLGRARYALSIIRIATGAPANDARRLVAAVASEYAHVDTPAEIIEAEVSAIAAFRHLATMLDDNPDRLRQQLTRATEAATAWHEAALNYRSQTTKENMTTVIPHGAVDPQKTA